MRKRTPIIEKPKGHVFHSEERKFSIKKTEGLCFCGIVAYAESAKREGTFLPNVFSAGLTFNEAADIFNALGELFVKENKLKKEDWHPVEEEKEMVPTS